MFEIINIPSHNEICEYLLRTFILQAVLKIRKLTTGNSITNPVMACSCHLKDVAEIF